MEIVMRRKINRFNGEKIIGQFIVGDYTVLLFDELNTPSSKVAEIDGAKYELEICFDMPNAVAVKGIGEFVGREVKFIK